MSQDSSERFPLNHYSLREIFTRLKPILRPLVPRLAAVTVLVLLAGALQALGPLFSKYIIDDGILRLHSLRFVVVAGGLFFLSQAVRLVLWYFAQSYVLLSSEDVVYALRAQGFRHLTRLCMRFHNRFPSGFIHDRVFERSICSIGGFVGFAFANVTIYVFGLIFALAVCLWLSPQMTAVILVGAVGYVLVSRRLSPRIYQRTLDATDAHNDIHSFILDKLRGTRTIQAYALEDRVEADFLARIEPVKTKWLGAQREIRRLNFLTEGLSLFITSVVYVMGAWQALDQGLALGSLVAFIGYQGQFIGFVSSLANMQGNLSIARAGFDQFYTVMDVESSVKEKPDAVMPADVKGGLSFDHVTFAYEDQPVLHDVSFAVPPGQTVALVGRSGAGKSTVANLLLRFYDPNAGAVRLDGVDIRELPVRPYRTSFGVVLQETFLFDDTVANNLRCARPQASDAELLAALAQAQARDFVVSSPAGLQTPVGEGGSRFSGGQRQRLAIARCMLCQPRFLILDEATSALDPEAEQLVQQALTELFHGRSAFIIAHRLSTIRRADRILVLDNGRLVEDGTFDGLLARQGLFARLHAIATSTSRVNVKLEEAGFA